MISIVIPTYNRAHSISKTIESFLIQSFRDWECVVVDDNSTDNTQEVIMQYAQQDSRIRYVRNERSKGAQGARNTGILHAQYDWVCLFDSDDYAYPDFLSKMVNALSDGVDIVTSYLSIIDTRTGKTDILKWGGDGNLQNDILKGVTYVAFNMAIIRKSKLLEIKLLDERCPAYQEFDTHIRLSAISIYKSVKLPLSDYYFCSPDSISVNTTKNLLGLLYIYKKHRCLWRKKQYWAFLKKTRDLFAKSDKTMRNKLIRIVPELLVFYPLSIIKKKIS